jgi:7-cyano-7-deazaguanine reductase
VFIGAPFLYFFKGQGFGLRDPGHHGLDPSPGGFIAPHDDRNRRAGICPNFRDTESHRMSTRPQKTLETFPNPHPERPYTIRFDCPEFTCLCPKTGQPDFATIIIEYVPAASCVELKSLKLYLWSYRDEGAFHEAVTNAILDDLVAATQPRYARVVGDFLVRGGIHTVVTVEHGTR